MRRLPDPAKQHERILSRLERTNDKAGEPLRKHMQDMQDIARLHRAGAIDLEHAETLQAESKETYRKAKHAAKVKHWRATGTGPKLPDKDYMMPYKIVGILVLIVTILLMANA